MTFKEYIAQAKLKANAAGDVMRLARRDAHLPEIATAHDLQGYLEARGLPESVIHSAGEAWEQYQRSTSKVRSA